jgi:CDP-glucose 4,6-dehydratase
LEPLSGYLLLIENLYTDGSKFAEAWNFGPNEDDAKTVEWVMSQLVRHWSSDASFMIDTSTANLHEAHYLKLNCRKARMRLGWKPQWDENETIKRICDWYKAYLAKSDMRKYSLDEIKYYQSRLLKV